MIADGWNRNNPSIITNTSSIHIIVQRSEKNYFRQAIQETHKILTVYHKVSGQVIV